MNRVTLDLCSNFAQITLHSAIRLRRVGVFNASLIGRLKLLGKNRL